jgi:hypothetical protein
MTNSQLAIPTTLATRTYSVQQEQLSVGGEVWNIGMINFKARIHVIDGEKFLVSNDSDFINRKQLSALDNVLSSREAKNVSLIRLLKIDEENVKRGFAVPITLQIQKEDGTVGEMEGRKVIVWHENTNPFKDILPAPCFLDEYVWVSASIFALENKLIIKASYAQMNERTRAKDAVVEKPKRLSLSAAVESTPASKAK